MRMTILVLPLLLSGCLATTTAQLKAQNPGQEISFEVDQGYQLVFRKVATKMRECVGINASTSQLYPDIKKGEVILGNGPYISVVTTMSALVDSKTRVSIIYGGRTKPYASAIEGWVKRDETRCRVFD